LQGKQGLSPISNKKKRTFDFDKYEEMTSGQKPAHQFVFESYNNGRPSLPLKNTQDLLEDEDRNPFDEPQQDLFDLAGGDIALPQMEKKAASQQPAFDLFGQPPKAQSGNPFATSQPAF